MRAMAIQGAFGLDNLRPVDLPRPEAGHGQVLLRIKAASLNYRDLVVLRGIYGRSLELPLVPLSDGCGVVEAAGEGVTRVKPGDRVCPIFFQRWISGPPGLDQLMSALGGPLPGCAQDYVVVDAESVVHVPAHLTDAGAACLPCAAVTAWRSVVVEGQVGPGMTVLVEGTGGVSIFALQFAKLAGAEVIVTSSSDEKLERARALGADHLINYRQYPDWSRRVRTATGGHGVDHVVEVGGAGTMKEALKSVRIGGQISVIGVLTGVKQDIQTGAIIATGVTMRGMSVGHRGHFEAMCRAIALHKLTPVVDSTWPLEKLPDALRHMEAGKHFGKVCIDVAA